MVTKTSSSSADFLFQKIASGKPANLNIKGGDRQQEARKWFRRAASEVVSVDAVRFINRAERERKLNSVTHNEIGQMLMFWYDAKLKEELPYWDRLPLIYPIEIYKDGFLGINLHYLPPMYRARLMDALYTTLSNQRFDKKTHLSINYQILKNASKFRYFRPCIKRYLNSHVQSKFVKIDPTEWDMALMLPTERFQKKRKQVVWGSSVDQIQRRK